VTQTPQTPHGGEKSLFLFDAYNFIFRAYHALPMLNAPDGRPVNAVHGFVRMVQAARRDFAPGAIAAVFDAGGDGGRRELSPQYKANRPPAPEDLAPQFQIVRDATDALGIKRIEHPKFEADDVIATYALRAQRAGYYVTIVSSDKDLMQLCDVPADGGPSIVLYDTMKQRVMGPAEVVEKFGVGPDRLGDLLGLTGDSSDNVPGVPGIGPKTAAALLHEYGDLEGVLAAAPQIKQKKRRERLIEHAENARLSRRLVALNTDVDLQVPLEDLRDEGARDDALLQFFEPLGFKMVLRELGAATQMARRRAEQTGPSSGDEAGAFELSAVAGYVAAGDAHRVWMAADADALPGYVAALREAGPVAVHVATRGAGQDTELVGVALCATQAAGEHAMPTYLPVGHQGNLVTGPQLPWAVVAEHVGPLLQDGGLAKVVHDVKTTTQVLAREGLHLAGVTIDTMLASYALDPARSGHDPWSLSTDVLGVALRTSEQVLGKGKKATTLSDLDARSAGAWLDEIVHVLDALGRALTADLEAAGEAAARLYRDIELPLSAVLAALEDRGIAVDTAVLHELSGVLAERIALLQARVDEEAGYAVNLDSPIQLRKLLFEDRGLPAGRKTKTGYSTDARVLEELSQIDPIVGDILVYRTLIKLKNTYLDTLPTLVRPDTGRLHTTFQQAVAATGRLSSTDPNIQNIPIRTAEGRRIREAFVAPEGQLLVAIDYSQIELRVLAHLSGDPSLRSAFLDDVDVHRRTAAEVFDVPEDEVTSQQRRIAKAVNFGVIYGQTAFGLAQQLGIPRGHAGKYIRAYFEKIPGVDHYMNELVGLAKRRGYAETILGRKRRIPELSRKGPARGHGERIARNTPIQGSAADILKVAMIAVERAIGDQTWARMLLTVHDELIFECAEDRVEELVTLARPLMEDAVELAVPLRVEAGWGKTWAACKG
jgi:DNA polymerase-1